jgi:protein-disulfide isomerase
MPAPLPPKPLGLFLGSRAAPTLVEVYVDPCCPFSKKIFLKLLEVFDWAESTAVGKLCIRVLFYPQPWHPQSTMLVESAVAVQRIDEAKVVPFMVKLFENVTDFYDASTYSKSRQQIYEELSEIAKDFVSQEEFLAQLKFQVVEGQKNSGNLCTQDVKWLVKYGRACGVHVTPTCFLNNIEAGHVSSGWELSEWQALLEPYFNA